MGTILSRLPTSRISRDERYALYVKRRNVVDTKPVITAEKDQGKANRLIQAIEAAFQARAKVGNEDTLLTLAYSTDP